MKTTPTKKVSEKTWLCSLEARSPVYNSGLDLMFQVLNDQLKSVYSVLKNTSVSKLTTLFSKRTLQMLCTKLFSPYVSAIDHPHQYVTI